MQQMKTNGTFVGLSTIDIIYTLDDLPEINRKSTARSQQVVVGGPATNAAITFAFLGGKSTLVTPVGRHATAELIREECYRFGVELIDLTPESTAIPPISSVWVNSRGERSVVSVNTSRTEIPCPEVNVSALGDQRVLMVDGHAMAAAQAWSRAARTAGVPIVLDGGSWKPGTEDLLKKIDIAICSADFRPPGSSTEDDIIEALRSSGVAKIAITRGADPVRFASPLSSGYIDIPRVQPVDTTGAGDIFHGAFCFNISAGHGFEDALRESVRIASESCRYPGTRDWMNHSDGLKSAKPV
jgi:sugar/nucleoside kinase (ribokinase family)